MERHFLSPPSALPRVLLFLARQFVLLVPLLLLSLLLQLLILFLMTTTIATTKKDGEIRSARVEIRSERRYHGGDH